MIDNYFKVRSLARTMAHHCFPFDSADTFSVECAYNDARRYQDKLNIKSSIVVWRMILRFGVKPTSSSIQCVGHAPIQDFSTAPPSWYCRNCKQEIHRKITPITPSPFKAMALEPEVSSQPSQSNGVSQNSEIKYSKE